MHTIRIGVLIFAFGLIVTSMGWGRVAVSQSIEQIGIADMPICRPLGCSELLRRQSPAYHALKMD
ncbi:hypothetical protein N9189_03190 [Pirellulaceae bacterium]|nr:hypothetical protein [Pirellulaceae bacterium]